MTVPRRHLLRKAIKLSTGVACAVAGMSFGHFLLKRKPRRYPAKPAQFGASGTRIIRPPGAEEESRFLAGCIRCYRCQDACEFGAIQFFDETAGPHYFTPYVDPAIKACQVGRQCMELKCAKACPTGVLKPVSVEHRAEIAMGTVELNVDLCLSYKAKERYNERAANWTTKPKLSLEIDDPPKPTQEMLQRSGICGECYMFCPMREKAITREPGEFFAPIVFADQCIGCGLCEEICRQIVRGEPAIRVVSTRGEV